MGIPIFQVCALTFFLFWICELTCLFWVCEWPELIYLHFNTVLKSLGNYQQIGGFIKNFKKPFQTMITKNIEKKILMISVTIFLCLILLVKLQHNIYTAKHQQTMFSLVHFPTGEYRIYLSTYVKICEEDVVVQHRGTRYKACLVYTDDDDILLQSMIKQLDTILYWKVNLEKLPEKHVNTFNLKRNLFTSFSCTEENNEDFQKSFQLLSPEDDVTKPVYSSEDDNGTSNFICHSPEWSLRANDNYLTNSSSLLSSPQQVLTPGQQRLPSPGQLETPDLLATLEHLEKQPFPLSRQESPPNSEEIQILEIETNEFIEQQNIFSSENSSSLNQPTCRLLPGNGILEIFDDTSYEHDSVQKKHQFSALPLPTNVEEWFSRNYKGYDFLRKMGDEKCNQKVQPQDIIVVRSSANPYINPLFSHRLL